MDLGGEEFDKKLKAKEIERLTKIQETKKEMESKETNFKGVDTSEPKKKGMKIEEVTEKPKTLTKEEKAKQEE